MSTSRQARAAPASAGRHDRVETQRVLDAETQRVVDAFLARLEGEYAPLDAIVFGSRARGDHTPDSDVDVAVILTGPRGDRYRAVLALSDAAYDILLETGIHIQPLPLWREEFEKPQSFGNPALIAGIRRDGIRP